MKFAILICVSVLFYLSVVETQENGNNNGPGIACTRNFDPVCGDDGITYSNECMLQWENEKYNKNINIKRKGVCETP